MNHIYKKIMEQEGMTEFKTLIKKWDALCTNMQTKPMGVPIILPDLFLISHSGTGRTHFLKLLSEYLAQKPNLMDFYGNVRYFEFLLGYCAPGEHFSEIQRLMTEIESAAGFRSEYRGIVYIDLDEWRGHCEEAYFRSFLEYLSDNSDDWLTVLSVSDDEPTQNEHMESVISAYLRTERLTLEQPSAQVLTEYALSLLAAYGITLRQDAKKLLYDSIEAISRNKYFDGYKSVKMLCQDVAYTVCSSGLHLQSELDADALRGFSKDSEYVSRMRFKIKNSTHIGFC